MAIRIVYTIYLSTIFCDTANILTKGFIDIDFVFIPMNGNKSINRYTNKIIQYNNVLLITDYKCADIQYMNIINNFIIFLSSQNIKVIHFKPLSVEEVILSCTNFNFDAVYSALYKNYTETGIKPYKYLLNDTYDVIGLGTIHNLEQVLFNILNKCRILKYSKSFISMCVYMKCCCNILDYNRRNFKYACKMWFNQDINKVTIWLNYSLCAAFVNIVNIFLGDKEVSLLKWSAKSKNELYSIN